ncbi:hypothetical protein AAZX31_01G173800 [Glycine max]|uniref:Protein RALF-like 34 n=3 Tax=Glycine subgen. Soja TaxID=1462606 RepID=I1J975_SOYBN|nr:hypothetical protein GYH30_002027 [Glycine max]KRH77008.1 hypothetical protein GLYMA_01G186800v4 [Glycine max]RZC30677.1 Protein RALF-like 34 [Glycine soja]
MTHSCKPALAHVTPCPLSPVPTPKTTQQIKLIPVTVLINFTLHSLVMASSLPLLNLLTLALSLLFCIALTSEVGVQAQMEETGLNLMSEALEWPTAMSLYDEDSEEEDVQNGYSRRSLFWRRMKYYISYGALSANRIPCPPRSGRSYYTHNCYRARGPVHPYSRGCSVITRCRR